MLDDFITRFVEESKSPLVAARGYLDMLSDKSSNLTEQQKTFLSQSIESIDRAVRLNDNILNFNIIEKDDTVLNLQPLRVEPIIYQILEDSKPAASNKKLIISYHRKYALSAVLADYVYLFQIMSILLDNLIKLTSPNSKLEVILKQKADNLHVCLIASELSVSNSYIRRLNKSLNVINTKTPLENLNVFFANKMARNMKSKIYFRFLPDGKLSFNLILLSCMQLNFGFLNE